MLSRRTLLAAPLAAAAHPVLAAAPLDVVIRGGRVIDPASGVDRPGDVGIRGGRIVTTRGDRLRGRVELDASGCVVAPGFVDILSGTHPEGDDLKIADGVTTVLSTHGGPLEVDAWYRREAQRRPRVHYGTVTGHFALRAAVGASDVKAPATPAQVRRMATLATRAHEEGALGLGFGIEYAPGTGGDEVVALAEVAAAFRTALHVHIRLPHVLDPFQGINELIAAAALTGARVQVIHIGSMAIQRVPQALALLDQARRRGIDIAADIYPYDAWMTRLQSALFDDGWQERLLLDYDDLIWVETGEKLTPQTFALYRKRGGYVACHQIREADIEAALRHPAVSVASDGEMPITHPRGAGTFARVLGRYVRERKVLSLPEALRKMTVQPLQRLEPAVPALRRMGRLASGMVADVTVFDPHTVIDRATFAQPRQPSAGIRHVLVAGRVALRDGRLLSEEPGFGVPIRVPHKTG